MVVIFSPGGANLRRNYSGNGKVSRASASNLNCGMRVLNPSSEIRRIGFFLFSSTGF